MEPIVSGVGVLDKALGLLRHLEPGPATLAELVERSGQSRATVHRLLTALAAHDLVRRADGRYALGWRLVTLGRAAQDSADLAQLARPALERLREASGESVQLYVRSGDERVCLAALDSPDELRTVVQPGARLPLDRGSAGAALAGTVGPRGWVVSIAERAAGVASVSAPVHDGDDIVAALGVSGPTGRLGDDPGATYGQLVLDAAAEVTAALTGAA